MSRTAPKTLPSCERLNDLFSYDPVSGVLTRKVSVRYNALAGSEVGCVGKNGYKIFSIDGSLYYVHRVIWKLITGEEPEEIDHIDGVRTNNAIKNLRSVTRDENAKNTSKPRGNSSGVIGVSWNIQANKWESYITVKGKKDLLGQFKSFEAAAAARKAAEIKYGFHKNHGRNAVQQGASA